MRTRFVREILSYTVVLAIGVAAALYLAPAKVTQVSVPAPARTAPEHAQAYMDALCRADGAYMAAHTSPAYASPEDVRTSTETARARGWSCAAAYYVGSFRRGDVHVFTALLRPGTPEQREAFYVLTFENGMVTNIE